MAGKVQKAAGFFQRARDVGAAHGFFSVECKACHGLGHRALDEGRHEEGLDLLRNALAASSLRENENDNIMELQVLAQLTDALFLEHEIDEVEPLALRYREASRAESQKIGRFCFWELESLYASARLLEVLNPSTPRLPCFRHDRQRLSPVIPGPMAHALVEPSAPSRHAGNLRRPRGRCALCST